VSEFNEIVEWLVVSIIFTKLISHSRMEALVLLIDMMRHATNSEEEHLVRKYCSCRKWNNTQQ